MRSSIRKLLTYLNTPNMKSVSDFLIDKNLIRKFLPPNPVIIDCGAHIGVDTIELSKIEGSKVFAFEAIPHLYQQLIENTRSSSNIKCFNVALSWFDGECEMYISSGGSDGSSSLLKPKKHLQHHPEVLFHERKKVVCRTIDTWLKENKLLHVDMLWLDMQGAEQKTLEASKKILSTVRVIHTEVSKDETYEGVESYTMFKKFLMKRGFKVEVEAIPKGHYGGNVLFIRK